ncbi:MAG TPA: hypothetical protein VFB12_02245, partial [Ktedonobacteraceae bacterium]|nr:hypothetical protein [Ktedonobacteraceae bacterium]
QHHIWQMVESTKNVEIGAYPLRRVSNAVSVIIFRFILEGVEHQDTINHESEDREAAEVLRKLLPVLRARLRKEDVLSVEDTLSISGPGILTAVIRAEQHGAELVSRRIQEIVQVTPVRIGLRGREVRVEVAHSSLTFAFKAKSRRMTVSSPLVQTALMATQITNGEGNLS